MPESSIPTVYVHLKPETMEAVMFAKSRKTSFLYTRSKKHQTPQVRVLFVNAVWMDEKRSQEDKRSQEVKIFTNFNRAGIYVLVITMILQYKGVTVVIKSPVYSHAVLCHSYQNLPRN